LLRSAKPVNPEPEESMTTGPATLAKQEVALDRRADVARAQLVFLLQLAYSGELGAARAYAGHRDSLRNPRERNELGRILRDELRHRTCILAMLTELGSGPVERRERKLDLVGRAIALFCRFGGWFFPMYGAGKLERQNIREYEHAARLARVAGLIHFEDSLLEMAEVEWDHERFFRTRAASHWLWRLVPRWSPPPPREAIRAHFAAFVADGASELEPVVAPWIVR
jgi:hypothetical protein